MAEALEKFGQTQAFVPCLVKHFDLHPASHPPVQKCVRDVVACRAGAARPFQYFDIKGFVRNAGSIDAK